MLVLLLLLAATARTYVLEPGIYDKIIIDDGEVWLGVYPAGDHAIVRTCKLRVKPVPNPDDDQAKATKVESTANGQPLFFLKGTPAVKPGNVTSLYAYRDDAPETVAVTLQNKKYVLRVAEGGGVSRLKLKLGAKELELGNCSARDSIYPVWAGDLDGDGRLDVYVRIEHHNYMTEQILYLSSADTTGNALTARAAVLRIRKLE